VESVGDAGEQSDLGVGGFDESLVEAVVEVGVDRMTVFGDPFGEMGEGGELRPVCP
jgi:hypothetical protein